MEKRWEQEFFDEQEVDKIAKKLGVNRIIAALLNIRGINTFEDAKSFFRPQLSFLHDPFLMKDMQKAVDRLEDAIYNEESILIYGDYDVDGATSVAMMFSFLKNHVSNIDYYIPCRYNEGYGISFKGIDYASENHFSLIIALDCGISAVDQIDYANKKNIDFIICDHHNPPKKTPKANAILNPKQRSCNYPYKELSGCGVGFKLIQAYCIRNEICFEEISDYLDLVAVSIAADIVQMKGENRILAFYGLKQLNSKPRAGLKALISLTKKTSNITVSDISFGIAPIINAAGRVDHAKKAVEILIQEDLQKALLLVSSIEENNKTRRNLDKSITEEALKKVSPNKNSIVVFSKKWHKGVIGIVASRLIEAYYKPTIVFSESNGVFTGSARSVHDFDLYDAISKCSYLCENFGGHKFAAGLSVKKENLNSFIDEFEKAVTGSITEDQRIPRINIDMEIDINDIDDKLVRIIKQFAPFGPSNPSPVFVTRDVIDNGFGKKIGVEKSHLRVNIQTKKGALSAIGFGMGEYLSKATNNQTFSICYSISENEWKGKRSIQLLISDIK